MIYKFYHKSIYAEELVGKTGYKVEAIELARAYLHSFDQNEKQCHYMTIDDKKEDIHYFSQLSTVVNKYKRAKCRKSVKDRVKERSEKHKDDNN